MALSYSFSELLTEDEVSAILKNSPRTLQQWRVAGKGPQFVKIGRGVRYRRNVIEAWLNDNAHKSTSDAS